MEIRAARSYQSAAQDGTREYILDMIDQLATMACRADEQELAIFLKAILDAARVSQRKRPI